MSRLLPRPLALLALTAVYALAVGSAAPGDLALGAVVAVGALALTRGLADERGSAPATRLARLARLPAFAWAVARDVLDGTWTVTRTVLRRRPPDAGVVELPIGDRSERGLAVSAVAMTISPGTALIDVDRDRDVMLVHVIDARDPDAVRERYTRLYEDYQRGVVP